MPRTVLGQPALPLLKYKRKMGTTTLYKSYITVDDLRRIADLDLKYLIKQLKDDGVLDRAGRDRLNALLDGILLSTNGPENVAFAEE